MWGFKSPLAHPVVFTEGQFSFSHIAVSLSRISAFTDFTGRQRDVRRASSNLE